MSITSPRTPSIRSIRRASPRTPSALAVALLLGGGAPLPLGCAPRQAPPALATGERPVTGAPRFDRVFADINAALVSVQEARTEDAEARGALARRVGLAETAPFELLGARLRERTAKLAAEGLTLQLEFSGIDAADADAGDHEEGEAAGAAQAAEGAESADATPPPTATLRTPGREPQPRELRLLEALAEAAVSSATVYTKMGRTRHQTERLQAEVAELLPLVDTSFRDADTRERTRTKLQEAREFLPQLGAQAREVASSADTLIALLDEAANTSPVTPPRKRPPAAPRPPAPRPPAAPPAPASAASKPPPPPTAPAAPPPAPGP